MKDYFMVSKDFNYEFNGIRTRITVNQFYPEEMGCPLPPMVMTSSKEGQVTDNPEMSSTPEAKSVNLDDGVRYVATIVKVEKKQSKNGNDQVVWTYEYTDGNGEKKTISQYTMINQKDNNKFLNFNLNALGLGGNGLPDFNSSAIQTKMINRKVEIKITEKEAGSYDIMMVRAL